MKNKKILLLMISLLIGAINYNLFLYPLNLITGGINSIATLINYIYHIRVSIILLIESMICTILCYLFLGKERTITTILASITYPILVEITSPLNKILVDNNILIIIISSILGGLSSSIMYKSTYSNAGLPIISYILYEKYNLSISLTSLLLNSFIVLIGFHLFGLNNTIYALIYLIINSIMIKLLLKNTQIKTKK